MNGLYPIFLKLAQKPVLVVGGGPVAFRRVKRLLEGDARVTVVSPEAVPGLKALAESGRARWIERAFEAADLEGAFLVLAATGDPGVLRLLRDETSRRGILFNAAEDESECDFHVPAVASEGDLKIAVSTGGVSPSAAARIRDELSSWLSANAGLVSESLGKGRAPGIGGKAKPGTVYLVGAGPGDPGLLTVRAAEILKAADVIYYDRLVADAVLDTASRRAEKIYVGKEVGCANRANIARLVVESARDGKIVVRLKGGDPMIFARGGEEMLHLLEENIDFEIVPGVSALSSVPASAGIPLTFRGVASQIIIRSGHALDREDAQSTPATEATYVYFMALSRLSKVVEELRAEGLPGSTPAAVIQKGTMPDQRVVTGNLENILEAVERATLEAPALFIAGKVVSFPDLKKFLEFVNDSSLKQVF